VINEFYNVMSRKFPTVTTIQARSFVESLRPSCTAPYTLQTIDRAYEVQDESGWAWYDCMIVASALQARCKYLISEDLQHERQIGGMQIIDPFQTSPKSLLPLS
jgi:predicted nucleic acid-binding protein